MPAATRRLVKAWAIMAVLTLLAIPVGHAGHAQPLGALSMIALLAAAFVKAALLLHHYLDLRHAPAWNNGLRAAVALLLLVIVALSLAARLTSGLF